MLSQKWRKIRSYPWTSKISSIKTELLVGINEKIGWNWSFRPNDKFPPWIALGYQRLAIFLLKKQVATVKGNKTEWLIDSSFRAWSKTQLPLIRDDSVEKSWIHLNPVNISPLFYPHVYCLPRAIGLTECLTPYARKRFS